MKKKFYRKILKNKMTVVFEKRELPVVAVGLAVKTGGINESFSEKGISHFMEHMLFKGTPTRNAQQIAEDIEKKGGILNAFTSEPITAYWCKIPSKHLTVALEILTDLIKNPLFDENEIEKEKKVIFEEIKLYKDNPSRYAFDEVKKLLYKAPFGLNLIGSVKTLSKINREELLKKFKETYQPNNFVLCVVGNADFGKLISFVKKNFSYKKGKSAKFKIMKRNGIKIEKRKGIDQANLIFSYHVPVFKDKMCHAAEILNCLMSEGMSSRLFREIREKRNLAYAIQGGTEISKDYAYNSIYVGTSAGKVKEVKKLILEEFKSVSTGLTEKELRQAKEQLIGNFYISGEDSQRQMLNLLLYETEGDINSYYEFEKKINKVTLKQVKELAKKTLKAHSCFVLLPENNKKI